MKKMLALCCVVIIGCAQTHRYEVDVSKIKDFEWNGQVRITRTNYGFLRGCDVHHVELGSKDGRAVSLNTANPRPEVHLIGDPDSHEPVKVLMAEPTWFTTHVQLRTIPFQKREDLRGSVDETIPALILRHKTPTSAPS